LGGGRPARGNRGFAVCALHFRDAGFGALCRNGKLPGAQVRSDDELLDYGRRNGDTVYHASCTCMMGPGATSVVDSELRVHGLERLRVIDASVMPAVTLTNTNAPTS
jgi:choline dehydrogenase